MPVVTLSNQQVLPGERKRIEIPVAQLPTGTLLSIPVEIVNGKHSGDHLWLSAAIHGDELNGVEIIRRVLNEVSPEKLRGCLFAVPVVNVYGFIDQSRYLPDRRDLNRSFPGAADGSLGSQLAHLFMTEVVSQCGYGIDLHTGSNHRQNLPQIRANLHDDVTRECAEAFGAPLIMHSETRDGSLRQAATSQGIHVLLYEAGEPMRIDAEAVTIGTEGVLRVMACRGMWKHRRRRSPLSAEVSMDSKWVRARRSGILRLEIDVGQRVAKGDHLGVIGNTFGDTLVRVKATAGGIVCGVTRNPLINRGEAIVHIARTSPVSP